MASALYVERVRLALIIHTPLAIDWPTAWLIDWLRDWLTARSAKPSRAEQETQRHLAGKEKYIYGKNFTCCSNALIYNTSIYYFCPFGKHLHCQDVPMVAGAAGAQSPLPVGCVDNLREREGGKKSYITSVIIKQNICCTVKCNKR